MVRIHTEQNIHTHLTQIILSTESSHHEKCVRAEADRGSEIPFMLPSGTQAGKAGRITLTNLLCSPLSHQAHYNEFIKLTPIRHDIEYTT